MKRKIRIKGADYTAEQVQAIRDSTIEALQALTDHQINELFRRDECRNELDGWPSGGGEEIRGSNVSRPTENVGLRLADPEHRTPPDPVHALTVRHWAGLFDAHGGAMVVKGAMRALKESHAELGRVDSTDTCLACGRAVAGGSKDPLVSGYCQTDRKAWERSGYMDRFAFEQLRRERPDRKAS